MHRDRANSSSTPVAVGLLCPLLCDTVSIAAPEASATESEAPNIRSAKDFETWLKDTSWQSADGKRSRDLDDARVLLSESGRKRRYHALDARTVHVNPRDAPDTGQICDYSRIC
jgi:hypothetical protein